MKALLVRPNYKSHIITPPIGLGYLASYLKRGGIHAKIIDGLRDDLSQRELLNRIMIEKPEVVGITCLTAFYNETIQLSRLLKSENQRVIIGGVHPTFLPYQTLCDSGCDFVVMGEGELALLRLLEHNFDNEGVPGVYRLEDFEDSSAPKAKSEYVEDLDDLPFPDWEQIDPNTYPEAPHGAIVKSFPIGVVTSTRGCPYECSFCATPNFYNRKVRFRTPENVVKEIEYLVDRFGVREIHFEDDNLTLKRSHVERICRLILERDVKIAWACPNGIRPDKTDGDLVCLMRQSGCYYFAYGIESASNQILSNVKKQQTIDAVARSIGLAASAGISCQGFFVFGLPGETAQTIEQTIQFAKNSRLARAQFILLDVIPGSELWHTLQGKFTPNWAKDSYKEPEWIPEGLTREHLLKAQSRAFREFYFKSPMRLARLALSVRPGQLRYLLRRLSDYRIVSLRKHKSQDS